MDEVNLQDLRRLAMTASSMDSDVDDLDADWSEDDRETIYDARYHAHKLYTALMRLWRHAEQSAQQERSGGDGG